MSKTETKKPNSDSEKKKNILVGVINLVAALMTKGHLHHYANPYGLVMYQTSSSS